MPNQAHLPVKDDIALASELLDIVNSSWKSQAISVAARLGIADLLRTVPLAAADLAEATGCHAPSMLRLMKALATLGIVTAGDDGTFALTPLGGALRSDAGHPVRSWAIWWGSYSWPVWGNLLYSLRTGRSARRLLTREDGFARMEKDTEMAATFNGAMAELTRLMAPGVVRHYDFSGIRRVLDVGGGDGEMLSHLLASLPSLHGTLYDLPHAVERARQRLAGSAIESRCTLVAGSFFDAVPEGADLVLLKSILHDWEDEQCVAILGNCRRAMREDARLLLVEHLVDARMDNSASQDIAHSDLNMLVSLGGRERTEAEFRALLEAGGFRPGRVIPADLHFHLIEALPA